MLILVCKFKNLFRSKEELYYSLWEEGGYYPPPVNKTPIQLLKDVLVSKRELLMRSDVKIMQGLMPRYSEIIVKNLGRWSKKHPTY